MAKRSKKRSGRRADNVVQFHDSKRARECRKLEVGFGLDGMWIDVVSKELVLGTGKDEVRTPLTDEEFGESVKGSGVLSISDDASDGIAAPDKGDSVTIDGEVWQVEAWPKMAGRRELKLITLEFKERFGGMDNA